MNKINIDANDPKWTAYALGEITDNRELKEMEAILGQSPEIAAVVEDIRETAVWLKEELAAEPAERLTSAQRERIEAKASKTSFGGLLFGWKPAWTYATAAVAVIVIALIAVRPFMQKNIMQHEPALIAEVFEKSSPAVTVHSERSSESEPPAAPQTPTPIPPNGIVTAADKSEPPPRPLQTVPEVAQTAAEDVAVLVAPKNVSVELPPPEIDEPVLLTYTAAANNGMAMSIREREAVVTSLMPTNIPLEVGTSTGAVIQEETLTSIPLLSNNTLDLINTMSGVSEVGAAAAPTSALRVATASGIATAIRAPNAQPRMAAEVERPRPDWRRNGNFNTEDYESVRDNPFLDVVQNPLSTFSIDVDTASYSNMRRFLNNGSLPPRDSVRIEELINYFDYDYKAPQDGKPFAAGVEMTEAPWNPKNRLLRINIKGREIAEGKRPESNLVFLIDVSGSMADYNKLPLVKDSMKMLVDRLTKSDRVAIVIYAGDTRLLLPSTRGDQKATLHRAIDGLQAGGSTNGASGIQLAYQTAQENFIKGGVNRIILATDGDFNVGVTNRGDLTRLIEEKANGGIFLSALGFGMGNYKDTTLELLADKGRGNYAYIDTENEARKVLVEQINSTLVAIAKDVKIQVEFNPKRVGAYRLLGYENRIMAKEDFNDDTKMAGVIGAGHAVTAFYELELAGEETSAAKPGVDPLRYQNPPQASASADNRELATVKIRSKAPEKDDSVLTEYAITDGGAIRFASASGDFKFAAAVAAFGMMLRDSPYRGDVDYERILEWAKAGKGEDRSGYREEFIRLVHRAASFPRR